MRKGLLLFLILFAVSCSNGPDVPAKLLSRDKMEDVLWDMMRADLFINNYMVIKDTALDKKKQGVELYSQILKIHKINEEQFKESYRYYRSQPMELKDLMDSLSHRNDTLQLRKPSKLILPADTIKKAAIPEKNPE